MKKFASIIVFILLAGFLHSQELKPDSSIRIGELENGLSYYIKDNSFPENQTFLRLVVASGSIDENENQLGLAHFMEHMAFNGTEKYPGNRIIDFLEKSGVRFGPDLNAYTSYDRTVYMINFPTSDMNTIEQGIEILAEWAGRISMEQKEIDKERGVVLEELRRGKGAGERISRFHTENLLKGSIFVDRDPIGKAEILKNFKREELVSFYTDRYRPELMAVIAVGQFDTELIEKEIREKFSYLKRGKPLKIADKSVPIGKDPVAAVYADKEAEATEFTVYYRIPHENVTTEQQYRASIVKALFSNMLTNRYEELKSSKNPPFISAYSGFGSMFDTMSFCTVAATLKNDSVISGIDAVTAELARVIRHGFTQGELQRSKAELMSLMETAYNEREKTHSSSLVAEYTRNFLDNETIPGIEKEYMIYKKSLPEITLEEVNSLRPVFGQKEGLMVLLTGTEKTLEGTDDKILMKTFEKGISSEPAPYVDSAPDSIVIDNMPEPGKTKKIRHDRKNDVTTLKLSNGSEVIIKSTDFRNDQILFSASSFGGSSLVSDKDWASSMVACAVAVNSGLGSYGKTELDKVLMGKNISLSPYIEDYSEGFSGHSSVRDLETVFQLIHLYFTAPRFDRTAYDSYMTRLENAVKNMENTPDKIFSDAFRKALYEGHFRGRQFDEKILEEISFEACSSVFRTRFADPGDFTFVFVGNTDAETVRELAEKYIASVGSVKKREKWADDGKRISDKGSSTEIYKGTDDKSQVLMLMKGDCRDSAKTRIEIDAVSYILDIRLREKIREEMGGTYSISAYPSFVQIPDSKYMIYIMFGCDPERTDELSKAVLEEIEKLKEAVPQEDLDKFKAARLAEYEKNLKENAYWLSVLEQESTDLNYEKLINRLKTGTLRKRAEKFFDTSDMLVLTLYPEIT